MPPPLRLEQQFSIVDVESWLDSLSAAHDLVVNKRARSAHFGGLASLIQLIATWSRRWPDAGYSTYIYRGATGDSREAVSDSVEHDHTFVAALLTRHFSDVGGTDLTTVAHEAARRRLEAMATRPLPRRGDTAILVCADGETVPFPDVLYRESPKGAEVVSEKDFGILAEDLLRIAARGYVRRVGRELITELASVLYELFSNADVHARVDARRLPYERSIRGIRISSYNDRIVEQERVVASNPALAAYLRRSTMETTRGSARFVEVSVFDNGPGLASRWLQQPIDVAMPLGIELEAVLTCLRDGYSSSGVGESGYGLGHVLRLLTL